MNAFDRTSDENKTPPPLRMWLTGLCASGLNLNLIRSVTVNGGELWCKGPLTTTSGAVGFHWSAFGVRLLARTCWNSECAAMIDGSGFGAKVDS